jgi:hypothetical protein
MYLNKLIIVQTLLSSKTSSFHSQLKMRVRSIDPQLDFCLVLYDKSLHQYLFLHLSELDANSY